MNIRQEQTPQPYALGESQQAIIEQVLRLSLEFQNEKIYSKANALSPCYYKQIKSMKMGRSKQHCSICMEGFNLNQIIKRLPCGHILHSQCAKGWLKVNRRCPLCRLNLQEHFQQLQQLQSMEPPPVTKDLLT